MSLKEVSRVGRQADTDRCEESEIQNLITGRVKKLQAI